MQRHLPAIALLLSWCAISLWLYSANMTVAPIGHHAWAMSDYYAMALRFQENSYDLFHPQTYNLRTREGITASDLPLPAWSSALLMALTGDDSAFAFRFLTWLLGSAGLFLFFKTMCRAGVPPWRATAIALLFGLIPGWFCYQNSILPSPWAFAAFLSGFWALVMAGFSDTPRATNRYYLLAVAGFTLAALLRKPFVLYLLVLTVWQWQHQRSNRKAWAAWASGLTIFGLWQLWDRYLGATYGSGFLRKLMAPNNVQEGLVLASDAIKKWGLFWLSPAQLGWLAIAIALSAFYVMKSNAGKHQTGYRWFLLFTGLAGIAYFGAMLRQFSDHDYYVIDTFYPALFVGAFCLAVKTKNQKKLVWLEFALVLLALGTAKNKTTWFWDLTRFKDQGKTNLAYNDSRSFLDGLNIPTDAKMLVFEASSDNAPLIGMRRFGYCLNSSKSDVVDAAMQRPWDFAVCLDTFFVAEVINDNPQLLHQLQWKGRSNKLIVFSRSTDSQATSLEKLTGLLWTSIIDTSITSGSNAEYLLSKSLKPLGKGKIMFFGTLTVDKPAELKATVALFKNGQNTGFVDRAMTIRTADSPTFRSTDFQLPVAEADEMRVYLWNPERRMVRMQDFKVVCAAQ